MVFNFLVPAEATRRHYCVYILLAKHRDTGGIVGYVGKTGDNREGCNPVISRLGNHFSFNKIHSQMRNKLPDDPDGYDFEIFFTSFGEYKDPSLSRAGVELINEMERELNRRCQENLKVKILNPHKGSGFLNSVERKRRAALRADVNVNRLDKLISAANSKIAGTGG